jgi:hypothetical protein
MENPNWRTHNAAFNLLCRAVRRLPISPYQILKSGLFTTDVLAVSGESVVAENGPDKVDKFMLRYPGQMSLEDFAANVSAETGAVTSCLSGIALPTEVGIKPARVLKTQKPPLAVVQTQSRLDPNENPPFRLWPQAPTGKQPSRVTRTLRDLESLMTKSDALQQQHGYYPDLGQSSENLRRNIGNGALTLIDVMPIYGDGNRLIGDRPYRTRESIQKTLDEYRETLGQFGG